MARAMDSGCSKVPSCLAAVCVAPDGGVSSTHHPVCFRSRQTHEPKENCVVSVPLAQPSRSGFFEWVRRAFRSRKALGGVSQFWIEWGLPFLAIAVGITII